MFAGLIFGLCGLSKGIGGTASAPFSEFYTVTLRGDFVTAAASLMESGGGTLSISIPQGARVVRAFLFWATEEKFPANLGYGNFDGHFITGIPLGTDCDNCWGTMDVAALWVADVTDYVSGSGFYQLYGFPHSGDFIDAETADGATLVVIWCLPSPSVPVKTVSIYTGSITLNNIYEGCASQSAQWTQGGFLADSDMAGHWQARYAISVANTQMGRLNTFYLNGHFMGYMQGKNHPGPLWDHWEGDVSEGYGISPGAFLVSWRVNASADDCIMPGVSIISVTTKELITDTVCGALGCRESEPAPRPRFSGSQLLFWGEGPSALYSASGALVWRGEAEGTVKVPLPGLKRGIYFLRTGRKVYRVVR